MSSASGNTGNMVWLGAACSMQMQMTSKKLEPENSFYVEPNLMLIL
jgi:hypothetical protein